MQPADPGGLLPGEAVAAQRVRRRVILAAFEGFRVESPRGGDDQFFSRSSSGASSLKQALASGIRCSIGIDR